LRNKGSCSVRKVALKHSTCGCCARLAGRHVNTYTIQM
jgi:hypothetical protein